jgi:hypothetical protein
MAQAFVAKPAPLRANARSGYVWCIEYAEESTDAPKINADNRPQPPKWHGSLASCLPSTSGCERVRYSISRVGEGCCGFPTPSLAPSSGTTAP